MALMVEMHRWIGRAPFTGLLDNIRSAQKTDFERIVSEKEAAGEQGPLVPTVWLRKERPAPGTENEIVEAVNASSKADDARDFIDGIDLMKKLKPTEYSTLIAGEKWSEQLEALQLVIDAIGPTPKIKSGCDVSDIIGVIRGFLRQGHVQLQVSSLKIITLLADGLRAEFGATVRPITQAIVMKCKEKRLCPEVQASLTAIVRYCLTFDAVADDLNEHIASKKTPPHGRTVLMEFVSSTVQEVPDKYSTDCLKQLVEAHISCSEDSDSKVRDAASNSLAHLAMLVKRRGKPAIEAHRAIAALEQKAPRVFKKIQAHLDGAPQGAAASSGSAAPRAAPESAAAAKAADAPKAGGPPRRAVGGPPREPAASSTAESKRPGGIPGRSATASTGAKKASGGGASAAVKETEDDNVDDLAMSPEDADAVLAALGIPGWEDSFQAAITSAKWQEKTEAVATLGSRIADQQAGGRYSAAFVVYLSSKTSGFRVSNINILKAVIQCAVQVVQNTGNEKFSKPAAWELIRSFGDKLSDRKTKEAVDELLTAFAEALGPNFVIKRMKAVMDKTKAPLAHQHYLEWLAGAVRDFGAQCMPVPFLGTFCQGEMDNKMASVRTAAIEVMGALYNQLGPRLLSVAMSDDMKPALKSMLEAEFAKVGYDPSAGAKATKAARGGDDAAGGGGGGGGLARQDLTSLCDRNVLTELNFTDGKTSWTNRKAAIESVITACQGSGHFLENNKGTGEIIKALKSRMNDTQANLKPLAASAIGHVVASLEAEVGVRVLRVVSGGLLTGTADNKKQMRDATIAAMQCAVTANGGESAAADPSLLGAMLPGIGEALTNTTVGRQDLLTWVKLHADVLKAEHPLADLVPPLVACMQDKTAAVRALAEQLMLVMTTKGLIVRSAVDKATRDLPTASKRSLQPSIERMMNTYGSQKGDRAGSAVAVSPDDTDGDEDKQDAPAEDAPPMRSSMTVMPKRSATPTSPTARPTSQRAGTPQGTRVSRQSASAEFDSRRDTGTFKKDTSVRASSGSRSPRQSEQAAVSAADSDAIMLKRTVKLRRVEEFYRNNWPMPPEDPSYNEMAALKATWEPIIEPELATIIFAEHRFGPPSQDSVVPAITALMEQLERSPAALWLSHSDLMLRYLAIVLCYRETSSGMLKVLQGITTVFEMMASEGCTLHEAETACILPHVIDRCGHKSERHKQSFKQVLFAASEIMAPNKINQYLLQGLSSKNKKSRVVCLEEMLRIVENAGATTLGKSGFRELGSCLDARDTDVAGRSACLDVCHAAYLSLGNDMPKLLRLLGDPSDKAVSSIEDRIKQRSKLMPGASAGGAMAASAKTASSRPTSNIRMSTERSLSRTSSGSGSSPASARKASSNDVLEDADEPFKLEMTPMGAKTSTKLNRNSFNTPGIPAGILPTPQTMRGGRGRDPRLSTSMTSIGGKGFDTSAILTTPTDRLAYLGTLSDAGKLPGMFKDIAQKIDCLLLFKYHGGGSAASPAAGRSSKPKTEPQASEEAKDYIKMLHSIATGEWSKEVLTQDKEDLRVSAEPLLARLLCCVTRCFEEPVIDLGATVSESNNQVAMQLDVDVTLLAVSLGTVFALIKRPEVLSSLSDKCVSDIYKVFFTRMIEDRLSTPRTDSEQALETVKHILKALNVVVLKLSSDLRMDRLIPILLALVGLSVPNEISMHSEMPAKATKPISRLIRRILNEHLKLPNAFKMPDCDAKLLFQAVHEFLMQYPVSATNKTDDTPHMTARTVLAELVKTLGGNESVDLLEEMKMPRTSALYMLTCKVGEVEPRSDMTPEVQAQISAVMEEIQTARDKTTAIAKLHEMRKQIPTLDISQQLQSVSSAFRRFILDQLEKLDEDAVGDENAAVAMPPAPPTSHLALAPSPAPSAAARTELTRNNSGVEALGILEGLIKPPAERRTPGGSGNTSGTQTPLKQVASNLPRPSSTPRSSIQDKIRGSLSNLSASLDLPAVGMPQNDATKAAGPRSDEDLAARLARLKSMREHLSK